MTQFKTPYNHKDEVRRGKIFTEPSQTVPDQSLTIPQLIERHSRGLPLDNHRTPSYLPENTPDPFDGINPHTLDLSEKHEIMESNAAYIQEELEKEKTSLKEKKKQKDKKDIIDEIEKEKNELKDENPAP